MTYTSQARKEGRWWVVQNDQQPGAISQVTRLDQAADAQREARASADLEESLVSGAGRSLADSEVWLALASNAARPASRS